MEPSEFMDQLELEYSDDVESERGELNECVYVDED